MAAVVGADDEGGHELLEGAVGEGGAAVGPPPRAGILVDVDLLAGLDLEDDPVRAPGGRLDPAGVGPRRAAVVGILPRPAERGDVSENAGRTAIPGPR
jgi:hypothetical protein